MTSSITNADIEKRLSALETAVALLQKGQDHERELSSAHFKTLSTSIESLALKFDAFMVRYEQQHADPEQSPAGRALLEHIERVEAKVDGHSPVIADVQAIGKSFRFVVGGSLLTALVALLAILKTVGAF